MKLIILDNHENSFQKLTEMTKLYPIDISINRALSIKELEDSLKMNYYDSIFINCINTDIIKQSNKLIKLYPKENFFLLYDKLYCKGNTISCKECKNTLNKYIIIKPLNQSQLTKIVSKSYMCESENISSKEFKIQRIKKIINKKYPYIKLDYIKKENSYSFIADNIPSYTLIYIAELLKQEEIEFEIKDVNKILII